MGHRDHRYDPVGGHDDNLRREPLDGHVHENGGHVFHGMRGRTKSRLWWALIINGVFLVVEVVGGILTGSLALLADAGHMLTDVAALVLAIFVATLAGRPATSRRTYGLLRAEVLGAFINGAALVAVVALVFFEAWRRFGEETEIDAPAMLVIAVLGLIANIASAWVLYGSRNESVNVRGAFLHMAADALGSVGAIVAGAVIWLTGWSAADPIASVFIGALILWGSYGLLTQTINILLESTPDDIDYHEVLEAILEVEHVADVHDLHIWTITSGLPSLSAHITLDSQCSDTMHWQECLRTTQDMLRNRFGLEHSTLQFEPESYVRDDRPI